MPLTKIKTLVDDQLAAVDQLITASLRSSVPLVEEIGNYITHNGGKRIRPILALLSARACGYEGDRHITLATIVEFIHTATLLHDDVVDSSTQRRGSATANVVWDNSASVLTGDFLYSRAFELMVQLDDLVVLQILAKASNQMAEGEVAQLVNCHKQDVTEQEYIKVIEGKTATLFGATCAVAARLAQQDETTRQSLHTYGQSIGCAFQIIDDVLDYTAQQENLGKNLGDDLAEGKLTLPLIYALSWAEGEQLATLQAVLANPQVSDLAKLKQIIHDTGALSAAQAKARAFIDQAMLALQSLPASPYRQGLADLAELVVSRQD